MLVSFFKSFLMKYSNLLKFAVVLSLVSMASISGSMAFAQSSDEISIGYGGTTENDLTASISSISGDKLEKAPKSSLNARSM